MATEENKTEIVDELGSSFLETQEGGNGTLDITAETDPSRTGSQTDNNENSETVEGEENLLQGNAEGHDEEDEEGDEALLLDADGEGPDADGNLDEEKETTSSEKEATDDSQKTATEKKEEQEEEEDAEESEEADKKMAQKFDPNQMPQVNVATLASE